MTKPIRVTVSPVDFMRALTAFPWPTGLDPFPCRDDPELFFPASLTRSAEDRARVNRAKDLCAECPIRIQCLTDALAGGYEGIWGGLTDTERAQLRSTPLEETA